MALALQTLHLSSLARVRKHINILAHEMVDFLVVPLRSLVLRLGENSRNSLKVTITLKKFKNSRSYLW